MTPGPVLDDPEDGAAREVSALAKVVARLRAEVTDLAAVASMTAVVERAKGAVMAGAGVSADAAYELLLERAARGSRSLLEECWITVGRIGTAPAGAAPGPDAGAEAAPDALVARDGADVLAAPWDPAPSPFGTGRHVLGDGSPNATGHRLLLARLAQALADTRSADDVAELLRAVLGGPMSVDAVMIYAVAPAGSLELTGHCGIDDAMAEQWSHVPPLKGFTALEAVASQAPVWLEDPDRDSARYLLIGGALPARWPSRAWLPVPGDRPMRTVVGFFRTLPGPFDAPTRTVLRRAVRLCGGPLRDTLGPSGPDPLHEDVDTVQRILDALPGTAVLLTPLRGDGGEVEDYRIDAAAPQSVDVAGRRGKELVGRRILETYPTVAATALWEGYLDTLATGTVYEGEPFTYEEVTAGIPQQSVFSVRASRMGQRLVVSWIRHDTSERETRRLTDLQRLGNLGWAGWNLAADTITWSDQVYAIFDRDPSLGPLRLDELPRLLLPDDLHPLGAAVQRLLSDGEAVDQPFRITTARGVRHLRIVAEAQRDADGTPVEVYGFFQDLTAQRGAEIALLESERANLVQRGMLKAEHALAARLQETLLPIPEQSLELAGLCIDVAFVAADSGLNVGGDWYSAIGLPDGSALFVVGDVAGHGLAAVGTMAQLRFTTKGMLVTGSALPDVLGRLNTLLLHTASEPDGATATVVMGRYQPSNRRLTWVRAGHLPPLLIRDGVARYLPQPEGALLGAAFDSSYGQATLDLLPGDRLLFYTDGLVEEPGEDIERGLARLADTALRLLAEGRHDMLARTLAASREGSRDDICVLDIHVPDDIDVPDAP